MTTSYVVPDVSREQAMNLYLTAVESSISYSTRVSWSASTAYGNLDVGERGEIKFAGRQEYNRALSLTVDEEEESSNWPNKQNLHDMWRDLADRIENDVVKS